jgi:hypothetical protein
MKRLIFCAIAVAVFAAVGTILLSPVPPIGRLEVLAGMSLQEFHSTADARKLPTEEYEDHSLVYSTMTKR